MQTAMIKKERFFVTFIDEASGRLTVTILYSKAEVMDHFVAYRIRPEKDTHRKIINRMPSRVHEDKSSYEIWTGNRPSIGHFGIFGSPTHILIPVETQRMQDPKSAQGIFIRYVENEGTRVYKVYEPMKGKIIILRDVVSDKANQQRNYTPTAIIDSLTDMTNTQTTDEKILVRIPVSQYMREKTPQRGKLPDPYLVALPSDPIEIFTSENGD